MDETIPVKFYPPVKTAKKKPINAAAKGKAHEREVAVILESQGFQVERARALYAWINGKPMAIRHDFFSCFDVIAVRAGAIVRFIQVSEWDRLAEKVKKIRASGFPLPCEIWGRIGGRNAHFRVALSNLDFVWQGITEMVVRKTKEEANEPNN